MTQNYAHGFWEIGLYKNNVRRIKDGIDQLEDYTKMLKERAELEAKYSKSLTLFSEKWRGFASNHLMNGSVQTAWLGVVSHADTLSQAHDDLRKRLNEEITKKIMSFRKENYHFSAFRAPKECREIEDEFEKAQRQWKKLFDRMDNAKKNFHIACSSERTALIAHQNAKADTSISPDTAQKFSERLKRCEEETKKLKEEYEKTLKELTQYRTPYVENMTFVFEKCQKLELDRCIFLLEQMRETQKAFVDLLNNEKIHDQQQDLENVLQTLNKASLDKDLDEWSKNYGVHTSTTWPEFETFCPEIRNISGKAGNKKCEGVILTKQSIKYDDNPITNSLEHTRLENNTENIRIETTQPKTIEKKNEDNDKEASAESYNITTTTELEQSRANATTAIALYDYNPVEPDEIHLIKDEIIELTSTPDSLGWCAGRKKDGESGFFPFSYVKTL
ncbi:unnamed protein product [Auanema sp. JU1783]|nr:unnamed protein product [Auanema sp. JU1783]